MQVKRYLTLRQTITTIAVTLFLLIAGISILLLPISETGYSREQITLDAPRHFSDLFYTVDRNNISFPDGGYLVPILHKNEPMAIAIYGYGKIISKENILDTKECLLILPQEMYYELMNQLYLQNSDENVFIDKTNDALTEMYKYLPFIITPTGKKFFSFPQDFRAVMLLDSNSPIKGLMKSSNHHPMKSYTFLLICLGYTLIFLSVLGFLILLTNRKYKKNEKESFYVCKPSPEDFRFHIVLILLVWVGLSNSITDSYFKGIYLFGVLFYSIYYLILKKDIYSGHLRLGFFNFVRSIPLALLLGLTMFILSTTALPFNIIKTNKLFSGDMFYLISTIVWICFLSFSYLLYELERNISLSKCLIIFIIIANILTFSYLYINGIALEFSILNSIIFTTIYTLIAFAMAIRTKSCFSPALALITALILTSTFL